MPDPALPSVTPELMDSPRGAPRGGATLGRESSARVDGWITRSGRAGKYLFIGAGAEIAVRRKSGEPTGRPTGAVPDPTSPA